MRREYSEGKLNWPDPDPSPECSEWDSSVCSHCPLWLCGVSSPGTVFYGCDWQYSHGLDWQPGNTQPTCHVCLGLTLGQYSTCHYGYTCVLRVRFTNGLHYDG